MWFFDILEIDVTSDIKAIKKAYAKMATLYHPEDNADEFDRVHKAYMEAMRYAKMVNGKKNIIESLENESYSDDLEEDNKKDYSHLKESDENIGYDFSELDSLSTNNFHGNDLKEDYKYNFSELDKYVSGNLNEDDLENFEDFEEKELSEEEKLKEIILEIRKTVEHILGELISQKCLREEWIPILKSKEFFYAMNSQGFLEWMLSRLKEEQIDNDILSEIYFYIFLYSDYMKESNMNLNSEFTKERDEIYDYILGKLFTIKKK